MGEFDSGCNKYGVIDEKFVKEDNLEQCSISVAGINNKTTRATKFVRVFFEFEGQGGVFPFLVYDNGGENLFPAPMNYFMVLEENKLKINPTIEKFSLAQ